MMEVFAGFAAQCDHELGRVVEACKQLPGADNTIFIYIELCGVTPPRELNGVQQKPIEGLSFADTLENAKAPERRKTQYFELGCNRGLYHDGWMASAPSFVPWDPNRQSWDPDKAVWELYNIDEDFSQANDLGSARWTSASRSPRKESDNEGQ